MIKRALPFSSLFWIVGVLTLSYFSTWFQSGYKKRIVPSQQTDHYASTIAESSSGVLNSNGALGATDFPYCNNCAMKLFKGYVIFGFHKPITDKIGSDLRVYEVDNLYEMKAKPFPREYEVYGSNELQNFKFIGYGYGTTEFDIRGTRLQEINFVKIVPAIKFTKFRPDIQNFVKIDALEIL
ncbi:MAG: hypothetical protein KDD61_18100 [Bdellovibrionales bacterium]|nr:hypothetical protein [Bdellovibrionales bacterium]